MEHLFDDNEDSDGDDDMEMNITLSSDVCRQQLLTHRPRTCGVMAFHNGTEEALYLFVQRYAQRGNAASILKAIDVFCYSRHWMMHCGDQKVQYLEKALSLGKDQISYNSMKSDDGLAESRGKSSHGLICLEIGSYCGYSAVKIASLFDPSGDDYLYCIENDVKCVHFTERMVEFAGLSSKVKVFHGSVSTSNELFGSCGSGMKQILLENHGCSAFNVLFIDHDKIKYIEDLNIIESCGLLKSGSIVVADNVLSFGQPLHKYLQHVRDKSASGLYSHSKLYKCYLEYSSSKDYCDDDEKEEEEEEEEVGVGSTKEVEMVEVKGTKIESYAENDAEGNKSETDGIEISIYR